MRLPTPFVCSYSLQNGSTAVIRAFRINGVMVLPLSFIKVR